MLTERIIREKKTVSAMIRLYCRQFHNSNATLCRDCLRLDDYAMARLDNCPFDDEKPQCIKCTVHCYNQDMKEEIRKVMRYSGPKMIVHHPYLAIMHIVDKRHEPKVLKKKSEFSSIL